MKRKTAKQEKNTLPHKFVESHIVKEREMCS